MDKKKMLKLATGIAFGGGLVIFLMGLAFDLLPVNPYSHVFWMIFLPLIIYFSLGADKKNIPAMIVSFACGLAWGFISNIPAFLFMQNNYILFAFLNYFLIAGLIVFIHQFIARGTVFRLAPCAFLGLAESIFVATCSIPDRGGNMLAPMTWGTIDLFIIYIAAMAMVTILAFFTQFIAGKIMRGNHAEGAAPESYNH